MNKELTPFEKETERLYAEFDLKENIIASSKIPWEIFQHFGNAVQSFIDSGWRKTKTTDDLDKKIYQHETFALEIVCEFLHKLDLVGPKPGRKLTQEEVDYCSKNKFDIGFDSDDPRQTECQHSHVCYPYDWELGDHGALCDTTTLWFQHPIDKVDHITCLECLIKLENLMKESP